MTPDPARDVEQLPRWIYNPHPVECPTCFAYVESPRLDDHKRWHVSVDGWIHAREVDREQQRWEDMGEDL